MGATGVCIGALTRQDCRSIRLCVADGVHHHPVTAPYRIGQVWDLAYEPAKLIEPPHVEDVVLAGPGRFVAMQSGMGRYLAACVSVWDGGPVALFGGRLRFTASGSGYLDREAGLTPSVGFWRPDRDLDLEPGGSQRYRYAGGPTPPPSSTSAPTKLPRAYPQVRWSGSLCPDRSHRRADRTSAGSSSRGGTERAREDQATSGACGEFGW